MQSFPVATLPEVTTLVCQELVTLFFLLPSFRSLFWSQL